MQRRQSRGADIGETHRCRIDRTGTGGADQRRSAPAQIRRLTIERLGAGLVQRHAKAVFIKRPQIVQRHGQSLLGGGLKQLRGAQVVLFNPLAAHIDQAQIVQGARMARRCGGLIELAGPHQILRHPEAVLIQHAQADGGIRMAQIGGLLVQLRRTGGIGDALGALFQQIGQLVQGLGPAGGSGQLQPLSCQGDISRYPQPVQIGLPQLALCTDNALLRRQAEPLHRFRIVL